MTAETTPEAWIAALDEPRRTEIRELDALIRRTVPSFEPSVLSGMLAYGRYRYRYASGREGEWCRVAIASNERSISLHVIAADERGYLAEAYRDRLPKADVGKSCVRFTRLDDVDRDVLAELIREASTMPAPGELADPTP